MGMPPPQRRVEVVNGVSPGKDGDDLSVSDDRNGGQMASLADERRVEG